MKSVPRGHPAEGNPFHTFGSDDHDPLLQVDDGLDQAEPWLLLLTQANAIVIHNHPVSVVQQPFAPYRPLGHLRRSRGFRSGLLKVIHNITQIQMTFVNSAHALRGRKAENARQREFCKGDAVNLHVRLQNQSPSFSTNQARHVHARHAECRI